MVVMTLKSGPHAGKTRNVTQQDAQQLFGSLIQHGWKWEIDWSKATPKEKFEWGRHELSARIVRALIEGRSVEFQGVIYTCIDQVGAVEDAIVASGAMVFVEKDDATGVVIKTGDAVH